MNQIHQEFDQFAKKYREILDDVCSLTGETSNYFAELKINKLAEWFPELLDKSFTALDFGCGDGLMTLLFKKKFKLASVYGVDPSPESIDVARSRCADIDFSVNSDYETTLNFDSEMFDVIVAAGAFHHIPYHMHKNYLLELTRILKKNGLLILFELNPLNPGTIIMFNRSPYETNARMLRPWETYKLARPHGGCSIKYYCFFPRLLRWFRPLEKWMTKVPFGGLYAAIIKK